MRNEFKEITEWALASVEAEMADELSPFDNVHLIYEMDDKLITHPTLDMLHAVVTR